METKNLINAFLVCMLILFGWQWLMSKKNPPPPSQTPQQQADKSVSGDKQTLKSKTPTGDKESGLSTAGKIWHVKKVDQTGNNIVLGDLLSYTDGGYKAQITVDARTAAPAEVLLSKHKFKITDDEGSGYPLLSPGKDQQDNPRHSLMLGKIKLADHKEIDLSTDCWEKQESGNYDTVSFTAHILDENDQPALDVIKSYTYTENNHEMDFQLSFINKTDQAIQIQSVEMLGPIGPLREDFRMDDRNSMLCFTDGDNEDDVVRQNLSALLNPKKSKDDSFLLAPEGSRLKWFAGGNKYFSAAVRQITSIDSKPVKLIANELETKVYDLATVPEGYAHETQSIAGRMFFAPAGDVAGGEDANVHFKVYLGSNDKVLFRTEKFAGLSFDKLSPARSCAMCTFNWLQVVIEKMFNGIYFITHNYGVAIIILVLTVRLILHPISKKSQVNMMKMSKMTPKIEEIKQKYGNNQDEMRKQMATIYKEMGPAQLLGCLPMMLQMPIWIALYTTVGTNIALRHQGLLPASWHWLNDLSAPDRLISFAWFGLDKPIHIPLLSSLMGPIDAFNLLPILLFIAMYLQMKLSPQSKMSAANPQAAQQQKMMMYMMPAMMLIFFYNGSSGLNLYIMSSTFAGLIEQKIIRKHLKEKEAVEAVNTVGSTSKVSNRYGPKKKKPKPPIKFG